MAKKKKCPECPAIAKWMTTFADMNSLLLTFFVLLLSMATLDKVKVQEAFGILSGGKGIFEGNSAENITPQPIMINPSSGSSSGQAAAQSIQSYLDAQNLQNLVSVVKTTSGFSVRVMDSVFFTSGGTELMPSAYPIVERISEIASTMPFYINVEGHTDDVPIRGQVGSNWDLSTARALSVLKFMQRSGVSPEKLSATGYGQYHPLLPNITPENRATNRRVEINFVSPEFFESGKNIFDDSSPMAF